MPVFSFSKVGIVKTLVSRESSPPLFLNFFIFFILLTRTVARYFMWHVREYAIRHVS